MITKCNINNNGGFPSIDYFQYTDDEAQMMSHAYFRTRMTRFGDTFIPTQTVGGVGTQPHFRRNGCVRKMLEDLLPRAREFGWYASIMHPFSFSYYRKFGYEHITDKVQVNMPMTALDFLPRFADCVPLEHAGKPEDILSVYEKFSAKRNLMIKRDEIGNFKKDNCTTYLYYGDSGACEGYVITQIDNYYDGVNRMVSVNLIVHEIVYLNRDALLHLLSFLRMYEGELETIHFRDIAMSPEVNLCLKRFMDTSYTLRPDVGVRILDTAGMLSAHTYPTQRGVFTLRVEDNLDSVRGTYRVEYENGTSSLEMLSDTASADITVGPTALAKLLYGTDVFGPDNVVYLDGVTLHNSADDFFRAFPMRINALYEHF